MKIGALILGASSCIFLEIDEKALKRMTAMQSKLLQLIKGGVTVLASDRWVKRSSAGQPLMPGVKLLSDDEICDFFVEHRGSIIDY